VRFEPKGPGADGWVDARIPPPCSFISGAVELAMVARTQWNGEFVADFAANRAALREPRVMNIRGPPAADKPSI